jgi:hypothetical protein
VRSPSVLAPNAAVRRPNAPAATAESWRGVLCSIYVENGDFSGTLDVSTFLSSFLAFFTAFFSFFASFRSPFVLLDIDAVLQWRCSKPVGRQQKRTYGHG